MTDAPIRAATAAEFADVGALIALAFHHLGPDTYVVPDPADRPRVMGQFFTMLVEHAAQTKDHSVSDAVVLILKARSESDHEGGVEDEAAVEAPWVTLAFVICR